MQRFAVRPPLDRVFPRDQTRLTRDQAATQAHLQHGYSQQEVVAHVGLHYSTVSRIVLPERKKEETGPDHRSFPPTTCKGIEILQTKIGKRIFISAILDEG